MFNKVKMDNTNISEYGKKIITEANLGNINSMTRLALMYECGYNVEKNHQKSIELLVKCITIYKFTTMHLLSTIKECDRDAKTNYKKVIIMCEKEIKTNSSDAMVILASMYTCEYYGYENEKKAVDLYEKAVELKNTTAMCCLSNFRTGRDRIKLYKQAAELGNTTAMYRLGKYYMDIDKVNKADSLLEKATTILENLYKSGEYYVTTNLIDIYEYRNKYVPLANLILYTSKCGIPVETLCPIEITFQQCISKLLARNDYNIEDLVNIINDENFDKMYTCHNTNPPPIITAFKNLLKEKIDLLENSIKYAPSAEGFMEARKDFMDRINKN